MNIKELAEQAGISFGGHPMNPLSVYFSELKRFAELILEQERKEAAKHHLKFIRECVEQEREACAKLCDELSKRWYDEGGSANDCAAAIRGRAG